MRNKLILFDWENIVESHTTGYTCYDAWEDLFHECGYLGNEKVLSLLYKYGICCIKSIKEFEKVYKLISNEFHLNKSYQEFMAIYKKIFDKVDYYKEVAQYEVSLKERCYIGILSNLTVFDKERLNKQVNLSQYDYVFLSFEMGVEKPNIEIFNKIQSQLPFEPKDILFIDDNKNNVETALKVGWNALKATGLELDTIKQKCEEFINIM